MTRDDILKEVLSKCKTEDNIILEWATGVGKTKASLKIAKKWKCENVLILVAETAHIANWESEIRKWKFTVKGTLSIACYASLHKFAGTEWDCIILDESHHSDTDIRTDLLSQIKTKHIVALSATLSLSTKMNLEYVFGKCCLHVVTIRQAIEWGILPKPTVHIYGLYLDNRNYTEEITYKRGREAKARVVECKYLNRWIYMRDKRNYPDLILKIRCTPQQKNAYLSEQIEYYKKKYISSRIEAIRNKWMQLASERKKFLGEQKTEKVRLLISHLEDKRYICFCASIEQSFALDGEHSINSLRTDNADIIRKFNDKEIDRLFAVGMAREGLNLTDIDAAVIAQLDGNDLAFIQKTGRALRAKEPDIHILYFKDTRDEEYLEKALTTVDKQFVIYEDLH